MAEFSLVNTLIGGVLIGVAAVILLLFSGQTAGNSGIVAGLLRLPRDRSYWKLTYVLGLIAGAGI